MIINWYGQQPRAGLVINYVEFGFVPRGTSAATFSVTVRGYSPVPEVLPDDVEHRRKIASTLNRALSGKVNVVDVFTLTANAASTTLTDNRITPQSFLGFMPVTANAAAELGAGTLYVPFATQLNGSAVITHSNNAQTDRSYLALIIG